MAEKMEKIEMARPVAVTPLRHFADWLDMPDLFRWFDTVRPTWAEEHIRVEEEVRDGMLVVRAELPGIDPDKDVEVLVTDGTLQIRAERRREEKDEHEGRFHSEFRYGSFLRTMALPKGVTADVIHADYADGILTVMVPMPEVAAEPKRIAIKRG